MILKQWDQKKLETIYTKIVVIRKPVFYTRKTIFTLYNYQEPRITSVIAWILGHVPVE